MSTWRGEDDPDFGYSVQGWSRQCSVPTDWEDWEPHGGSEPPPPEGGQWFSIGAMFEEYDLGGNPRFLSIGPDGQASIDLAVKDNAIQPTKLLEITAGGVSPFADYLAGRPWLNPPYTKTVYSAGATYSLVDDTAGGGQE